MLFLINSHRGARRIPPGVSKLRRLIHIRTSVQALEPISEDLAVSDFFFSLLILLHKELFSLLEVLLFHLELLFIL